MAILDDLWDTVKRQNERLRRIQEKATSFFAQKPTKGREIMYLGTKEVTFTENTLGLLEPRAFIIGASNKTYIGRVSYNVRRFHPTENFERALLPTPAGLVPDGGILPANNVPVLDFLWNLVRGTTGKNYAQGINSPVGSLVPREDMGTGFRQNYLVFDPPMEVNKGEFLLLNVQPTLYAITGTAGKNAATQYTISFTMEGWRVYE